MAKCDICNKGVTFGIKVSHSHRRSNRTWKPNVKKVKAVVQKGNNTKTGKIKENHYLWYILAGLILGSGIMAVILYIGFANLIGLFGFKPPTKDLNVTAALAIMSIVLIEVAGFRKKGLKRWLKSFAEPMPVVLPINILELFIKPLSLCMRLFGNVLGAFVVMELLKIVVPVFIPVVFSLYFDIFDGLIQAYVFVFLTSLFIEEAVED